MRRCRTNEVAISSPWLWAFGLATASGALVVCATEVRAADRGAKPGLVEPLPAFQTATNAGVFIGVNKFSQDKSIRTLNYAVNDAIAQAYHFVLELKFLPPGNVHLLISGAPTGKFQQPYQALAEAGVRITTNAIKTSVLKALEEACVQAGSEASFLVVSISSHGFEDPKTRIGYILPEDALLSYLEQTGISVTDLQRDLDSSEVGKRLLLVDACREHVRKDTKDMGAEATMDRLQEMFSQARGRIALMSCDNGQLSYENDELQQGVFTSMLVEALKGQAGDPSQEFLTLGQASEYVSAKVYDWVRRKYPRLPRNKVQSPSFFGPEEARSIPLGVSARYALQRAEARRNAAIDILLDARKAQRRLLSADVASEIEQAINGLTGEKLAEVLGRIEELRDPNARRVEDFVAWWSRAGRQAAPSEGARSVSKPEADERRPREQISQVASNGPRSALTYLTLADFREMFGLKAGDTAEDVGRIFGPPDGEQTEGGISRDRDLVWTYRAGGTEPFKVKFDNSTKVIRSLMFNENHLAWLAQRGASDPKTGLIGKSSSEIEKLLGKPSMVYTSTIRYEGKGSDIELLCPEYNRFRCSRIELTWKQSAKSPK